MARRPDEFRWSLLPTLAAYCLYRFKKEGLKFGSNEEVVERFGMPLNGVLFKIDRNIPEAIKINSGEVVPKKGSNHHDRKVSSLFKDYQIPKLKELFSQILEQNISSANYTLLMDVAVDVLKDTPTEKEFYVRLTIDQGLDIRSRLNELSLDVQVVSQLNAVVDIEDDAYIKTFNSTVFEDEDEDEDEDESGLQEKKPTQKQSSNQRWPRDQRVARRAIKNANYECVIDPSHRTFLRAFDGKPYLEPHHIIPMAFQNYFEKSLDVLSNIIALCPTCHREVHLSEINQRKILIDKIFKLRCEDLGRIERGYDIKRLYVIYGICFTQC